MLTPKEYKQKAGKVCPFCMSEEINSTGIVHEMMCESCRKVWMERYTLVGYEPEDGTEVPRDEVETAIEVFAGSQVIARRDDCFEGWDIDVNFGEKDRLILQIKHEVPGRYAEYYVRRVEDEPDILVVLTPII